MAPRARAGASRCAAHESSRLVGPLDPTAPGSLDRPSVRPKVLANIEARFPRYGGTVGLTGHNPVTLTPKQTERWSDKVTRDKEHLRIEDKDRAS